MSSATAGGVYKMKLPSLRAAMMLPIVFALLILTLSGPVDAATLLDSQPAADGRVIRLDHALIAAAQGHLVAAALAPSGGEHVEVYTAAADNAPFTLTGQIDDPVFPAIGVCCGAIYELPRQIGGLPAGTLLWAASVGANTANKDMSIRIYSSADEGQSWSFLSAVKSPNPGPIWEPEFTIGQDGALILFYSDETQSAQHSQFIRKVRSYDGLTWQDSAPVVASDIQADRPGMPVVRQLANGNWMMTYELCGPAQCIASYRLSADGWDWGSASDTGSQIRLPDGSFPAHTPRFTLAPGGAILLATQLIETPSLGLDPRNGRALLVNDAGDPATPWRTIAAPVIVPDACSASCPSSPQHYESCPNYSPSLLTTLDGRQMLEFASDWSGSRCYTSYAWAPWQELSGALTAAVLPSSRAVQVGTAATLFGVVLNTSNASLDACQISLPSGAPAGLSLSYQTTSANNALTGSPDTPATIAGGGSQNFLLNLTSTSALSVTELPLVFDCAGSNAAPSIPGVNTVDLLISNSPTPDIITLAATPTNNGIVAIPYTQGGAAAFAVASIDAGMAGTLTVRPDTGSAKLPLTATICATNPTTGACLAPPAASLEQSFTSGGSQTFSVFVTAGGAIPFDPATARVFLRFLDAAGTSHGATSVAVQTQ